MIGPSGASASGSDEQLSSLQEVLAPIDRSEFIRQVDYYGDLYGDDEE